jgi:3-keto-L-gulonate-6-phosphate decarboxylase
MYPIIQIAIDTTSIDSAIIIADAAVKAGADWIEIGNPLIKFEGRRAIESIAAKYPNQYLLVDYMILAGAKKYITAAKESGAKNVTVCGLVPDYSIQDAINEAKINDMKVTVDLFNISDIVAGAKKFASMGADYVMVHYGVDQKKFFPGGTPIHELKKVVEAVDIPVAYATYGLDESIQAVKAGAKIIVQGEPLTSAFDLIETLSYFIQKTKEAKLT